MGIVDVSEAGGATSAEDDFEIVNARAVNNVKDPPSSIGDWTAFAVVTQTQHESQAMESGFCPEFAVPVLRMER